MCSRRLMNPSMGSLAGSLIQKETRSSYGSRLKANEQARFSRPRTAASPGVGAVKRRFDVLDGCPCYSLLRSPAAETSPKCPTCCCCPSPKGHVSVDDRYESCTLGYCAGQVRRRLASSLATTGRGD